MLKKINYLVATFLLTLTTTAFADITVPMYLVADHGMGKSVGNVTIQQTRFGLVFTPHLTGLTPGEHGFHIHQNPSCEQSGAAAGGHLDPQKTGKHLGPYNDQGHLGDLPAIYVNADGSATLPVLAPRFKKLDEVQHHALMVHTGGDNYSDTPEKLGGGDGKMACGVIK